MATLNRNVSVTVNKILYIRFYIKRQVKYTNGSQNKTEYQRHLHFQKALCGYHESKY